MARAAGADLHIGARCRNGCRRLRGLAFHGRPRCSLALAPVLLLVAAIASHRIIVLHLLFFVLATTTAGWLFGRPVVGPAAGMAVAIYAIVRSRRLPADLTSEKIRKAAPDAVSPGAKGVVAEFERLGCRRVGAITTASAAATSPHRSCSARPTTAVPP